VLFLLFTVCFNQVLYFFFFSSAAAWFVCGAAVSLCAAFFNILFLTQPHLIMVPLRSKSKVVIWVLSSPILTQVCIPPPQHIPGNYPQITQGGGRKIKKLQHLIETDGTFAFFLFPFFAILLLHNIFLWNIEKHTSKCKERYEHKVSHNWKVDGIWYMDSWLPIMLW
jgi:hypothetical protein